MDPMQALLLEPRRDRPATQPERHQLPTGNDAMLPLRELRDRRIISIAPSTNRTFCIYVMHNVALVGHGRIVARSV